ncbi:MAG: carbohydrate binding family 9 domain-containing protein [Burkholderiales bacterium]|nr:carbohydrate binding family 9 domain-containing protein [Burkholderiales bacterium]
MPRVLPILCCLMLCCALATRASAQEMIPIYQAAADIHEPQLRPEIDGKLNDSVWLLVFGLRDFVALMPGAEGAAVVPTEVMLAHDKEFLYIGLRALDPNPADIRANYGRRDRIDQQDDSFAVFIDPLDSGKSSQFFMINANGVLADGLFYSDGQRWDFTPDFSFEGAAQQDQHGWSAELKIPLSQLQFGKQEKNWRLVVMRKYVRNKEWHLRSLPLVRNQDCYLCVTNDIALREFWPVVRNAPLELKTALQETEEIRPQKPLIKVLDFSMRPHESVVLEGSFRPSVGDNTLTTKIAAGRQFASAMEEERAFFLNNADLFPYLADSNPPQNIPVYTPSISDLAWCFQHSKYVFTFFLTTKLDLISHPAFLHGQHRSCPFCFGGSENWRLIFRSRLSRARL